MPAEKGSMHWEKSPADLTERFAAVTDRHPDIARRKMFGEIAGFVNGNMVTGLHSGRWFVRLTGDDKAEALALPGSRPVRTDARPADGRLRRHAGAGRRRRRGAGRLAGARDRRRPSAQAEVGVRSSIPHGEPYAVSRSRNGTASNASGPSTPAPRPGAVGQQLQRDDRVDRRLPDDGLIPVLAPSTIRCRPRGTGRPRAAGRPCRCP